MNIDKTSKNFSSSFSIVGDINEVINNFLIGVSQKNGLWITKNPPKRIEGISSSFKTSAATSCYSRNTSKT